MRFILSRKGFDSSAGGMASPILDDGTLLSLPIPSCDKTTFSDIQFRGKSYYDIICELDSKYNDIFDCCERCHVDPDLINNRKDSANNSWKPSFGQTGSAGSYLSNRDVKKDDIFLFFGWFKQTEMLDNWSLSFLDKTPDLHILFGYMQIGEILNEKEIIKNRFKFHPHASNIHLNSNNNRLYIPPEKLKGLNIDAPGYGLFKMKDIKSPYDNEIVLTKENKGRSTWRKELIPIIGPSRIKPSKKEEKSSRKNTAEGKDSDGLQYSGQWQEIVFEESEEITDWFINKLLPYSR